ncbi:hypothetical protein NEOLEDRAFT_1137984 [Neolentinus lepideus HHB14362 ss-1]|uniref:Uncharacterized protein n=1 Tax=Neolentinus lepideus HHB14362 ss-1 TaxID=1314782 RepID=A0A165QJL6_9AGAM|nr:hypothetical protein NEOLEDRAFT_1137984 [Neolentinus lepideus HHB14362 ss-1]
MPGGGGIPHEATAATPRFRSRKVRIQSGQPETRRLGIKSRSGCAYEALNTMDL